MTSAGRPRDPQIDAAILKATIAVLDRSGYGGFTLEDVARHARTTKPAIYRRWGNRQRLMLDALGKRLGESSRRTRAARCAISTSA